MLQQHAGRCMIIHAWQMLGSQGWSSFSQHSSCMLPHVLNVCVKQCLVCCVLWPLYMYMSCAAAGRHVLDVLEPLSDEHGGPLHIQHVSFVEGRGNIIVQYPGTDPNAGVVSFVGAHLVSSRRRHALMVVSCSTVTVTEISEAHPPDSIT